MLDQLPLVGKNDNLIYRFVEDFLQRVHLYHNLQFIYPNDIFYRRLNQSICIISVQLKYFKSSVS